MGYCSDKLLPNTSSRTIKATVLVRIFQIWISIEIQVKWPIIKLKLAILKKGQTAPYKIDFNAMYL